MKIKEQFYLKILSGLKFLTNYFNGKLGEYYTQQNREYADSFLKKFRAKRSQKYVASLEPYSVKPRVALLDPRCEHLKGGRTRSRASARDYSIACHTFPDGTQKAWCTLGCGFVSYPGDQNWLTATNMLKSSSNTASRSEILFKGVKPKTIVTVQDSVPNVRA